MLNQAYDTFSAIKCKTKIFPRLPMSANPKTLSRNCPYELQSQESDVLMYRRQEFSVCRRAKQGIPLVAQGYSFFDTHRSVTDIFVVMKPGNEIDATQDARFTTETIRKQHEGQRS